MHTAAVIMEAPGRLAVHDVELVPPGATDLVVEIAATGISSGTEKLLWQGRMPDFPGMGYPLVPGYEAIGTVVDAGRGSLARIGDRVFVPGARCFRDARPLFGAAARRLVVPESRVIANDTLGDERGLLLALAATARHALAAPGAMKPELIVGHGTVGRLLARIAIAEGSPPPIVWERQAERRDRGDGYIVTTAEEDPRHDYRSIYDCSGDAALMDTLIGRLARGGELVLAGFYAEPVSFAFPPAFMREARLRVAAEWLPDDMAAVNALLASERLSFDGLISDRASARDAPAAYARAFTAPDCLKMILDWSEL